MKRRVSDLAEESGVPHLLMERRLAESMVFCAHS